MNDHGDVVGSYSSIDFGSHGFVLQDGVFTTLGESVFPRDINNRGDIVGTHSAHPGQGGFLLDAHGTITPFLVGADALVTDINNARAMVGVLFYSAPRGLGFSINKEGTFTFMEMFSGTNPHGITDRGDIVGFIEARVSPAVEGRHGVVRDYRTGEMRLIDVPGATNTVIFGANNRGDLIGVYDDGSGQHAFLLRT